MQVVLGLIVGYMIGLSSGLQVPMTCRRSFLVGVAAPTLVAVDPVLAATSEELKGLLGSTQAEIEASKVAAAEKKKKVVEQNKTESIEGNLFDFNSIAEKQAAAGRARAQARREQLLGGGDDSATKAKKVPKASSDSSAVYAELRAKREAKKEEAAAKLAEKKKNLTPLEEFRANRAGK